MNACIINIRMLDGVVQRHFSHLGWEHPRGRAFRHNSQLHETPAAKPKAERAAEEAQGLSQATHTRDAYGVAASGRAAPNSNSNCNRSYAMYIT